MESRREVEEFLGCKWETRDGYGRRIYCVQVKANGEEKPFNLEVVISNTVRSTQPNGVEHGIKDADWEAIAKVKVMKGILIGCLDDCPITEPVLLGIDYPEIEGLFFEAIREGMIAP